MSAEVAKRDLLAQLKGLAEYGREVVSGGDSVQTSAVRPEMRKVEVDLCEGLEDRLIGVGGSDVGKTGLCGVDIYFAVFE